MTTTTYDENSYPARCGSMSAHLDSLKIKAKVCANTLEAHQDNPQMIALAIKWFRELEAEAAKAIAQDDRRRAAQR